MKYNRIFLASLGLIAASLFVGESLCQSNPVAESAPASAPTSSAVVSDAAARQLAFEMAEAGNFVGAKTQFEKILQQSPDDAVATQSLSLIKDYLLRREKADAARKSDYEQTVSRIARCSLCQSHKATIGADAMKDLRQKISKEMGDAYAKVATGAVLEDISDKRATTIKEQTLNALKDVKADIDAAVAMLKDDTSEYAKTFRDLAAKADTAVKATADFWQTFDVTNASTREAALLKYRPIEDSFSDAVDDLSVMVAEDPWKMAAAYARLAKELADNPAMVTSSDWYKKLLAEVENAGKQAIDEGKWQNAYIAYANLAELEPQNTDYRKAEARAERRVRIQKLYGKKTPASQPASAPASTSAPVDEEQEMPWQQIVAGVDAELVKRVIQTLRDNYVDTVDFKKLTLAALNTMKILAETKEVAGTFPGLADDAKRNEFIKAIDAEIDNTNKKDAVDHLHLVMTFNSILASSENTVNIPLEVLAVEFTDGFLGELDKFSAVIWPSDMLDFNKQTMGHFFGIGIQISKEPNQPLKVVSPLEGSPAFAKGIKTGDMILSVDGKATENRTVDDLVKQIMGPKGTTVVLKVQRRGVDEPFDVTVERDEIVVRTIKGWQRQPGGSWDYMVDKDSKIGYIRLTQFTSESHEDLVSAIKELRAAGAKSLILDLRFDPGGLLQSAAMIADEFLDSGRIVSTRGRQTDNKAIDAVQGGEYLDGDMIVLINPLSASASEILSGAMKDWRRSLIVGQRSYGKGSVQQLYRLGRTVTAEPKAILKLTNAHYYLPSGRLLHRKPGEKDWGVDPDVAVNVSPKQTKRWLDIRHRTDLINDVDPKQLAEEMRQQYDLDVQLSTAVLLLQLHQLSGKDKPVLASDLPK